MKAIKAIFKREVRNKARSKNFVLYENMNYPENKAAELTCLLAAYGVVFDWRQNKRYKAFNLREQDIMTAALVWCKEIAPNVFKITNYRALERKVSMLHDIGKFAPLYLLHQGHGNQHARKYKNNVTQAKNINNQFGDLKKQAISTLEKYRAATILNNWIDANLKV